MYFITVFVSFVTNAKTNNTVVSPTVGAKLIEMRRQGEQSGRK
jgi:hypothetical protein